MILDEKDLETAVRLRYILRQESTSRRFRLQRIKPSREELTERAFSLIRRAREETKMLMELGFIPPPPQ